MNTTFNKKDMLSFGQYIMKQAVIFSNTGTNEDFEVTENDLEAWKDQQDGTFFIQFDNPTRGVSVRIYGRQGKEAQEEYLDCHASGLEFEWGGMKIDTRDSNWKATKILDDHFRVEIRNKHHNCNHVFDGDDGRKAFEALQHSVKTGEPFRHNQFYLELIDGWEIRYGKMVTFQPIKEALSF